MLRDLLLHATCRAPQFILSCLLTAGSRISLTFCSCSTFTCTHFVFWFIEAVWELDLDSFKMTQLNFRKCHFKSEVGRPWWERASFLASGFRLCLLLGKRNMLGHIFFKNVKALKFLSGHNAENKPVQSHLGRKALKIFWQTWNLRKASRSLLLFWSCWTCMYTLYAKSDSLKDHIWRPTLPITPTICCCGPQVDKPGW